MSREKTKTFEESMARLEDIVDLLQENEQPLDETIKLFEEGLKLVRDCEGKLKEFETKVAELSEESEEN
jgi:exodeoxyribonuclease VII small subunit